jgi:hypothetical protein
MFLTGYGHFVSRLLLLLRGVWQVPVDHWGRMGLTAFYCFFFPKADVHSHLLLICGRVGVHFYLIALSWVSR